MYRFRRMSISGLAFDYDPRLANVRMVDFEHGYFVGDVCLREAVKYSPQVIVLMVVGAYWFDAVEVLHG